MANDNSVLMNINSLFEMEADRRAETAASVERERAELAARELRERREREDALRRVREDERRRAADEAATKSEAVEGRIANLRAELDEVRVAREQMRLEVAAIAARPAPTSSRANWIVGAMAAVSLVAAMTATAVSWPEPIPPVDVSPVAALVDETPVEVEAPTADAVVVAALETRAVDETPESAVDERPVRPHPPRPPRTPVTDLGQQLDFGPEGGLIPDL